MTELQESIYKTLLEDNEIDKDIAKQAAVIFEPCYCIISKHGELVYQGLQNNDYIVLSKYKKTNGYDVIIYKTSQDFKLESDQWREIKELVNSLK